MRTQLEALQASLTARNDAVKMQLDALQEANAELADKLQRVPRATSATRSQSRPTAPSKPPQEALLDGKQVEALRAEVRVRCESDFRVFPRNTHRCRQARLLRVAGSSKPSDCSGVWRRWKHRSVRQHRPAPYPQGRSRRSQRGRPSAHCTWTGGCQTAPPMGVVTHQQRTRRRKRHCMQCSVSIARR